MTAEQQEKLRLTFCQVLNLPRDTKPETLQRSSLQPWDSLVHVSLVSAIETEFQVLFEPEEFAKITSFESATQLLDGKLPAF